MKDEIIQQALFNHDSNTTINFKDQITSLQKELLSFGFTPNLSKVYIYLGKYGPKTAFDIVKALKIRRTEAYGILKVLMNKGIVYSTMQHPMRFFALPLEKAIWNLVNVEKQRVHNLERNGENLVRLWHTIPNFMNEKPSDKDDRFQILKGGNQIRAKVCEMVQNSKEIQMLCSEKEVMGFYHSDAFMVLDKTEKNLRLLVSRITTINDLVKELKHLQVKKTSNEVHDNLCFVVNDNELLFYTRSASDYPSNIVAFWSDSIPLIYSMRMLFDFIWSQS